MLEYYDLNVHALADVLTNFLVSCTAMLNQDLACMN